ncbi:gamma-butyrobetaine hydroxylase-like domain-containing protein [Pararobbsia alpina]|uniref:Gamma-butyrobetaine hydroxylase-like N-terminal domain-containing protein n=1 Tax=Pararobbsia alpina TaxID=621374 RepID=A0A6S7BF76_9BURK|nr:gamma-butyrobetaine hydroxylase-like domain-containing protein [Pararobbsia alpina]CAB3796401.1 hypothetical protein LMG28138_04078 [Pararobbsia alpina]
MNVPERIELDAAARLLSVHWPGGVRQSLPHAVLRMCCPCSTCRRIRLRGDTVDAGADISIVGIAPMGYGVQLIFSDGHDRGIFPWPYLEQLRSLPVIPIPASGEFASADSLFPSIAEAH